MKMKINEEICSEFGRYLIFEKRLSLGTRDVYCREISLFLSWLNQNNLVCDSANVDEIEKYLLYRNVSARTRHRIVSTLSSFYRFLIEEKLRVDNPVELLPQVREVIQLPHVASINVVEQFLDAIDLSSPTGIRDRALFEIIYSCGLRVSEAISLKVSDIYKDKGFLRVVGKRRKMREVPVGDVAYHWLKIYLKDARPSLILKHPREQALFVSRLSAPLSRVMIWKRLQKWADYCGKDVNVTVHTLRHSFATHMLINGADLRVVQELLGHADIRTTQIYTHLGTENLKRDFDKYHPLGSKHLKDLETKTKS